MEALRIHTGHNGVNAGGSRHFANRVITRSNKADVQNTVFVSCARGNQTVVGVPNLVSGSLHWVTFCKAGNRQSALGIVLDVDGMVSFIGAKPTLNGGIADFIPLMNTDLGNTIPSSF